jgi:hypothetical protein
MKSVAKSAILRDFVYLDAGRLYSLYSQVFEGVADQIVNSFERALTHSDEQRGPLFGGSAIESRSAELSRRTENTILYDSMYARFEERMSEGMVDASKFSVEILRQTAVDASFVRVTGNAELEDYGRMRLFFEKFNEIGAAIAYAKSQAIRESTKELLDQAQGIKDRNQRQRRVEEIKRKSDPKRLAQALGMWHEEELLKNLVLFNDLFHPEGFDVIIAPTTDTRPVSFRAPVDRQWLRTSPEMLRALYGNFAESPWTVIGQVTYVPGDSPPKAQTPGEEPEGKDDQRSMRDPFRNMFRAAREFERMFFESKQVEVVICPLAIYRVTKLPDLKPPTAG